MEKLLDTKEVAARLGVCRSRIRQLVKTIPGAKKFGRDWSIPVESLKTFHLPNGKGGRKPKKRKR